MAVVSNSSPLIAFAAIGQLHLLPAVFRSILIPPAVALEIAPSIPTRPSWLHIQGLKQPIPGFARQRSLGAGEGEALALAIETLSTPQLRRYCATSMSAPQEAHANTL